MKDIFFKFKDFTWDKIKQIDYKPAKDGGVSIFYNVSRQNIIESNDEIGFDVRYFECGEDGFTTLEKHEHVHVVLMVRGEGKVLVNKTMYDVRPFDSLIIPSWAPHQLINTGSEPFGFICSVNGKRDKFKLLSEDEIDELKQDSSLWELIHVPDNYTECQD